MAFFKPPRRGFTVPMLATLASAVSRACTSGVRSGNGIVSGARTTPLVPRARTRCRISAITAASSSPLGSSMLLLTPTRGNLRKHPAAWREFAGERRLYRVTRLHHVAEKPVDHVLLKNSEIAIRQHVHLQRLQLQAQLVGNVAQRQLAVIGQPGLGTNRSELRQHD